MPNKEPRRILLQSIFGTDEQKKKRFMSTMSTKRKRWPIEKNRLRQVMRVDGTPWCKGPEYIRKCLDGVRLESFSFSRHQKEVTVLHVVLMYKCTVSTFLQES